MVRKSNVITPIIDLKKRTKQLSNITDKEEVSEIDISPPFVSRQTDQKGLNLCPTEQGYLTDYDPSILHKYSKSVVDNMQENDFKT